MKHCEFQHPEKTIRSSLETQKQPLHSCICCNMKLGISLLSFIPVAARICVALLPSLGVNPGSQKRKCRNNNPPSSTMGITGEKSGDISCNFLTIHDDSPSNSSNYLCVSVLIIDCMSFLVGIIPHLGSDTYTCYQFNPNSK